jgi:hypothetical protein
MAAAGIGLAVGHMEFPLGPVRPHCLHHTPGSRR